MLYEQLRVMHTEMSILFIDFRYMGSNLRTDKTELPSGILLEETGNCPTDVLCIWLS